MKEEYVSYQIVLRMLDLGFNEDTEMMWYQGPHMNISQVASAAYVYDYIEENDGVDSYPAPRFDQAQTWFLEKHNLYIEIRFINSEQPAPWTTTVIDVMSGEEELIGRYTSISTAMRMGIAAAVRKLTEQCG